MSTHSAVWVVCDRCYESAGADLSDDTRKSARVRAKAAGFVRRKVNGVMGDLCPECATAIDNEERQ